jgi:hypothetical protein
MALKLGDISDAVKTLQRGLNKLGSVLTADGHFGPGTQDAIAAACPVLQLAPRIEGDDELLHALAAFPDPCPPLTAAGMTFVARFEVGSAKQYKDRYFHPVHPKEESGITIGIGYDLQFVTADQLKHDWGARLSAGACATLAAACGKKGSDDLLKLVGAVEVPFLPAMSVYVANSLPNYIKMTAGTYPQLMTLPEHRRAALVSLVYNRGAGLKDVDKNKDEDRREMRAIRDLLAARDVESVPAQLDSMTRLWDPKSGLVKRRQDEATLWRSGFAAVQL